jgi:hypothetical protein
MNDKSIEENWKYFKDMVDLFIQNEVPLKQVKRLSKPWITKGTIKLITAKRKAWQTWKYSASPEHYEKYRNAAGIVKNATNLGRLKYEEQMVNLTKKDSKSFFKFIKSQLRRNASIPALHGPHGVALSDQDKATLLNSYFSSVFLHDDFLPRTMPSPPLERKEQFQPQLEALDVEKQLGKLKRSRASGPDGISPLLLKLAAKSLAKPLSFIFRQSIEHGVLPQDWKDANVLPILKAQKLAAKLDGYRPISLTCMVCRVFEKLLKRSLLHFFLLHDHIDKEQYGFLARRSTTLQMLVCNEEWTKLMDENERVDIIYLDFKKAFDSVSHKALLCQCMG